MIAQSTDRVLTVTNYRVLYRSGAGANMRYASITHDAISSCSLTTSSQPILLILGILAGVIGLVSMQEEGVALTCFLIAGLMIVLFFVTQSAAALVCSNGGERLLLPASGARRDELLQVLSAIDEAKIAATRDRFGALPIAR